MSDIFTSDTEHPVEAPTPAKPKRKPAKKAPGKGKGKAKRVKAKGTRAPRTRDVTKLDAFGFRKGSIKSQAAAIYQAGATLSEVKDKLGSVQYNVLTELKSKGFTVKEKTIKGRGGREVTHFKVTKTKGA